MKIVEFNKPNLRTLSEDIQIALNEVAKKHGLHSIKLSSGGTFSPSSFTTKFEARTCEKKVDPLFIEAQERMLVLLGLPKDAIGRQFISGGMTFQIDRIDPKKYKMPVIAMKVENGTVTTRGFKFQAERVASMLQKQGS